MTHPMPQQAMSLLCIIHQEVTVWICKQKAVKFFPRQVNSNMHILDWCCST